MSSAPQVRAGSGFATLLRHWRERRRLSQQQLSLLAEVSARHLSFLETGRSRPSREMVLTLAEHLQVPLRERNELLTAAGFATAYPQRPYDAPELATVRAAVDQVLAGHDPYPAVAVDRAWTVVAANDAVTALLGAVGPAVLGPPTNVYRLTLHPDGLAPLLVNLAEVAHHLLDRLRRDIAATGDAGLSSLVRCSRRSRTTPRCEHSPAASTHPTAWSCRSACATRVASWRCSRRSRRSGRPPM